MLVLERDQSINLPKKKITDWFLHDRNIGLQWVKDSILHFTLLFYTLHRSADRRLGTKSKFMEVRQRLPLSEGEVMKYFI